LHKPHTDTQLHTERDGDVERETERDGCVERERERHIYVCVCERERERRERQMREHIYRREAQSAAGDTQRDNINP